MKKLLLTAICLAGLSGAAQAATLNFIAEANGNERGVTNGTVITMDGINVTFSSSHYAYFDSGNAGLGVCKVWNRTAAVNDNECNPSSDDNVTLGESVTIGFDRAMTLSGLLFSREGHTLFTSTSLKTLLFGTNGGGLSTYTFGGLMGSTFYNVRSATFAFDDANFGEGRGTADQFYLASATVDPSPVPVPAALPLLLAGLGGFGLVARRRKTA